MKFFAASLLLGSAAALAPGEEFLLKLFGWRSFADPRHHGHQLAIGFLSTDERDHNDLIQVNHAKSPVL